MGSDVRKLTDEERAKTRRWVAMLDADRATLRDEVEQDVAQYRHLTPDQAERIQRGVVEAGWNLLEGRQDRQAVLDHRDPPAPDFESIWARLVERGWGRRARRGAHSR